MSFLAAITNIRHTIPCAITVASAAPATLSSGNGPIPKINNGSSMALATSPTAVERNTIELAPIAVNSPVSI